MEHTTRKIGNKYSINQYIIMTIQEFLQGDKFAIMAGVELLEVGKHVWKSGPNI